MLKNLALLLQILLFPPNLVMSRWGGQVVCLEASSKTWCGATLSISATSEMLSTLSVWLPLSLSTLLHCHLPSPLVDCLVSLNLARLGWRKAALPLIHMRICDLHPCRWENGGFDRRVGADSGHCVAGHCVQCAGSSAAAGDRLLRTAACVRRGLLHCEIAWHKVGTSAYNLYLNEKF